MNNYIKKDWHKSPDKRKRLGVRGEDRACEFLSDLGLTIIDRNVRYSIGELDIVALDKDRICFIEVKTRSSMEYGRPSLALTAQKQKTIRRLAECYMHSHKKYARLSPRIDVIELLFASNGKEYINYIKSAF